MGNVGLIGVWSNDMLYGVGAQEDTWLAFLPDGTGWIAFLHYTLCERDTFVWSLSPDGKLWIKGDRYRCAPEVEVPSSFSFENLIYKLSKRELPLYGETEVLTFDREIWCGESEFALLSRREEKLDRPLFEDERRAS